MKVIQNPESFQQTMEALRRKGKTLGFVPTMGALHEGHLTLVRKARKENDIVAVSIFVNPLQFGPREDVKKYPRTFAMDRQLLKAAKADYLFKPSAKAMYPEGYSTVVDLGAMHDITNVLCGKSRPGHFRGVATVVSKLFHIAKPHRAYFGAKDFQQAAVIRRLIRDLNFDIELRVVPTVREKDGLAMSSRNRYLTPAERKRALALSQTLFWVRRQIRKYVIASPGRSAACPRNDKEFFSSLKREAVKRLKAQVDRVDYFKIVDGESLESVTKVQKNVVALTACFVGKTRLIDNVSITQ